MNKLILTRIHGKAIAFLMEDEKLVELAYEKQSKLQVGQIFVGKVKNVLDNIEAAFVEFEKGQLGFLAMQQKGQFHKEQEILVQVLKEAVREKRPVLTTNVSLAGKYVAVSVDGGVGFSRKLSGQVASKRKAELTTAFHEICERYQVGVVLRSVCEDESILAEDIIAEADKLAAKLSNIRFDAKHRTVFSQLSEAKSFALQMLERFSFVVDLEVVTDQKDIYEDLLMTSANAHFYEDASVSLQAVYGLRAKYEEAFKRKVWLKCGGFLIIEETEALHVIDVNSGKLISGKDKEQTLLKINKEAAIECARQMRLRNLNGMILIDFINCENEQEFIDVFVAALKKDRVKASFVDITKLGLVEVTRQKIEAPLSQQAKDGNLDAIFRYEEGISG